MIRGALIVTLAAVLWGKACPAVAVPPPPIPSSEAEAKAWELAEKRRETIRAYRLTSAAQAQVYSFVEALAQVKRKVLQRIAMPSAVFVTDSAVGEPSLQPIHQLISEENLTSQPQLRVNAVFDVGYGLAAAVEGRRYIPGNISPKYSIYIFQFDNPEGSDSFLISSVRELEL